MPGEINAQFRFDTGIERIIDRGETAQLPQSRELLPVDKGYEQQLPVLLYPPNWDQELQESLKPPIQNTDLLTPSRFQAVLHETRSALDDALKTAGSGADRQTLQAAASLLEEQQGLRDLLNTYRHLLHKA